MWCLTNGSRPLVLLSDIAPVRKAGRKAVNYISLGIYKVLWIVLHGMSAPFLHNCCFMWYLSQGVPRAKTWLDWPYALFQFYQDVSPHVCFQFQLRSVQLPGKIVFLLGFQVCSFSYALFLRESQSPSLHLQRCSTSLGQRRYSKEGWCRPKSTEYQEWPCICISSCVSF